MLYKYLSKYEKLSVLQELNFSGSERHNAAVYLKALWQNDVKTLDEYESLGDKPYQFLTNKRIYDKNLLFGYTEKKIGEWGWMLRPKLFDIEEIKLDKYNEVSVGCGANGKWTYGEKFHFGNAGGAYSPSVFGEIYDSKKDAFTAGINRMITRHTNALYEMKTDTCGNYNEKLIKGVIKAATAKLSEIKQGALVQLELF